MTGTSRDFFEVPWSLLSCLLEIRISVLNESEFAGPMLPDIKQATVDLGNFIVLHCAYTQNEPWTWPNQTKPTYYSIEPN